MEYHSWSSMTHGYHAMIIDWFLHDVSLINHRWIMDDLWMAILDCWTWARHKHITKWFRKIQVSVWSICNVSKLDVFTAGKLKWIENLKNILNQILKSKKVQSRTVSTTRCKKNRVRFVYSSELVNVPVNATRILFWQHFRKEKGIWGFKIYEWAFVSL